MGALQRLDEGYAEILEWLRTQHKTVNVDGLEGTSGIGSWVNPDLKVEKEMYIKRLVVFNHYRKIFKGCWKLCQTNFEVFNDMPRFYRSKVERRTSIAGYERPRSDVLKLRMEYEATLRDFAVMLEEAITDALLGAHTAYDTAKLFKCYAEDVIKLNEKEEKKYKQRGMRCPNPDWKLKDPTDPRCPFWYATGPTNDVPYWEQDENVCNYFP